MNGRIDAHTVPLRAPWGWVPHAVVLVVLAAALLVGTVTWRVFELFRPIPECPGSWGCGFSPLADAPAPDAVVPILTRSVRLYPKGDPETLGPEWDGVEFPWARAVVAGVLAERERQRSATIPPVRDVSEVVHVASVYAGVLDEAWQAEVLEERERRRAGLVRLVAVPVWQLVGFYLAVLASVVALADRRLRHRPVVLDGHGVRHGERRWLWEELREVRWRDDHVVLLGDDGEVRLDGADLDGEGLARVQHLSDRLLEQARARPASDRGRALEHLLARVAR